MGQRPLRLDALLRTTGCALVHNRSSPCATTKCLQVRSRGARLTHAAQPSTRRYLVRRVVASTTTSQGHGRATPTCAWPDCATEPVRPEPTPREISAGECAARHAHCGRPRSRTNRRRPLRLRDPPTVRRRSATAGHVSGRRRARRRRGIETTIDLLDATIAELRKAIFSLQYDRATAQIASTVRSSDVTNSSSPLITSVSVDPHAAHRKIGIVEHRAACDSVGTR